MGWGLGCLRAKHGSRVRAPQAVPKVARERPERSHAVAPRPRRERESGTRVEVFTWTGVRGK